MYSIYTVSDTFKMPPEYFGEDIEKVAAEILERKYEGRIEKEMGVIVAVFNVRNIGDGAIYPGDPATHHDVEFDALTFMPVVEEILPGEVTEMVEFGAFVRIGPMDGLVHVSQIAGEFLSFDKKALAFVSKKNNISLKKGDAVFAKISTVSMKNTIKDSKIALTMKPEGLGKPEWAGRSAKAKARRGSGSKRNR
ncbi:MAG: DNA-directed RNA polymerase [Candidatus Marsarchaeota archaeon]|nr:DNA-directed RNA polymerase [Candidatus Marsarchaeota archaeon]MCL5115309.1 DNA-directed RNA polymerase [Candidatus Marsarchaeota archaeon]